MNDTRQAKLDPSEQETTLALPTDVSLAEGLYLALRDDIMTGTMDAGTRLREIEVAQKFGVSRTPVREALKKLEVEGLIADIPGRGLIVAKPSLDEILDDYLLREVLEGLAARLAAERALETDVLMLKTIMQQVEESHGCDEVERALELSYQFDEVVFRAARNPRLYRLIEAARASHGSSRRGNIRDKERRSRSIEERQAILKGIAERSGKNAEFAAQEHLRRARDYWITKSLKEGLNA